jgi:hypothetical protein
VERTLLSVAFDLEVEFESAPAPGLVIPTEVRSDSDGEWRNLLFLAPWEK